MRILPALLLLGLPAAAPATPAGTFIDRFRIAMKAATGRAVKAHGDTQAATKAVAEDPELVPLARALFEATWRYRSQVEASEKAGRPRACLPGTVTTTFDDIAADAERLPAGWRERDLADVVAAVLDRR